jgi:hypothetical protein
VKSLQVRSHSLGLFFACNMILTRLPFGIDLHFGFYKVIGYSANIFQE